MTEEQEQKLSVIMISFYVQMVNHNDKGFSTPMATCIANIDKAFELKSKPA